MTLRQKTLIAVGLTLVGLMVVLYAGSRTILLNSFSKLEEQETQEDIERAQAVLADNIAQLDRIASDWAPWDDTAAFVQGRNESYIESNLTDGTFITLRLNLMVFVDVSGKVFYSEAFDLENKTRVATPPGLQKHLTPTTSLLLRHADASSSVSGIVFLTGVERPLMVAAWPIVNSSGEGPIRGTLIIGRYLGDTEVEQLANLTRVSLALYRFDDAPVSLSDTTPRLVRPLNEQIVAGYTMYKDIYGNPALVLKVETPRDIYHQGQVSLNYLLWSLVVAGLVFIGMTMLLWDQLALIRLARLSASVSRIGVSSDLSARVEAKGSDELSNVAGEINRMLETLQRSEGALRESEARFRRLAENAQDMIYRFRLQPSPGFDYVSPAANRMTGYTAEEFYADPNLGMKLVHPDDKPLFESVSQSPSWLSKSMVLRWVCKDGTIIYIEQRNVPVYDSDGNLVAFEGIARDVTERKLAEEALRESEGQFRRRAAELRALYETSLRLSAQLETSELLRIIVEQAVELVEADAGGLYIYDPQQNQLVLSVALGFFREHVPAQISPGQDLTGQVFEKQHSMVIEDYPGWSERLDIPVTDRPAMLAVPLLGRAGVLGVLDIASRHSLAEHEVKLTELFAAQAAVALETSRLHAEVQRRARGLTALNKASQAILSALDLHAVLELVIAEVKSLLNAEGASVLLHDPVTDGLVFATVDSPRAEQLMGKQIPPGTGIAGWVMQKKQATLVADAYHDPRFSRQIDGTTGMTTRSLAAVPLVIQGTVKGVLEAINKAHGAFDQQDLEMLEAMAGSAAIAMENARLFREVRETAGRLQALSRRLVEVQEAERSRIARELHDETSQALTFMMVNLHLLERDAEQIESVRARAAELKRTTNSVMENLHRLAMDLRPASLDHVGLVAALRQYVETFRSQHTLNLQFEAVGLEGERMPREVETAIYRIVQEALTNVARHAHASRVDVVIERRGDSLVAIVEDNGVGFDFDVSTHSNRLGLAGMRERAEMLGGTLTLESETGTGTTVLVEVPYVHSHSDSR